MIFFLYYKNMSNTNPKVRVLRTLKETQEFMDQVRKGQVPKVQHNLGKNTNNKKTNKRTNGLKNPTSMNPLRGTMLENSNNENTNIHRISPTNRRWINIANTNPPPKNSNVPRTGTDLSLKIKKLFKSKQSRAKVTGRRKTLKKLLKTEKKSKKSKKNKKNGGDEPKNTAPGISSVNNANNPLKHPENFGFNALLTTSSTEENSPGFITRIDSNGVQSATQPPSKIQITGTTGNNSNVNDSNYYGFGTRSSPFYTEKNYKEQQFYIQKIQDKGFTGDLSHLNSLSLENLKEKYDTLNDGINRKLTEREVSEEISKDELKKKLIYRGYQKDDLNKLIYEELYKLEELKKKQELNKEKDNLEENNLKYQLKILLNLIDNTFEFNYIERLTTDELKLTIIQLLRKMISAYVHSISYEYSLNPNKIENLVIDSGLLNTNIKELFDQMDKYINNTNINLQAEEFDNDFILNTTLMINKLKRLIYERIKDYSPDQPILNFDLLKKSINELFEIYERLRLERLSKSPQFNRKTKPKKN